MAADIPQNKSLRMWLVKGKGHENIQISADIPKKKAFKDAVIERERA